MPGGMKPTRYPLPALASKRRDGCTFRHDVLQLSPPVCLTDRAYHYDTDTVPFGYIHGDMRLPTYVMHA